MYFTYTEIYTFRAVSFYLTPLKWVSYSFIFPVIIDTPSPKSPHGEYNQRLVMFNFRSDLSQLPPLHFLLISFTYVTVIKGVHLSFLDAGERTGIYTGAFHKAPLTRSYHHKQTQGRNKVQDAILDDISGGVLNPNHSRWCEFVYGIEAKQGKDMSVFWGSKITGSSKAEKHRKKKTHCLICLVIIYLM